MDTARTLEEFIAFIQKKGLQLALITPTSGFIGSHLAEALLAQNLAVLCEITNNPNTTAYTKHLQANPHFFLIEHSHEHELPINLPPPKYIIYDIDESYHHFNAGESISFAISLEAKRLLEYATTHKARFLLLSAVEEAAKDPFPVPKTTKQSLSLEGTEHLAELKRFVTTLISETVQKSKLDGRVVQYAEVYGPRMDLAEDTTLPKLINQAVNKRGITIAGDGLQPVRPLYISDFIYGVIKTLFLDVASAKTYRIVHPNQMSELNFSTELQHTASQFGLTINITFTENDKALSNTLHAIYPSENISDLVWQPKVEVQVGTMRTLSFFLPKDQTTSSSPTEPIPEHKQTTAIQKPNEEHIVLRKPVPVLNKKTRRFFSLLQKKPEAKPASTAKQSLIFHSKRVEYEPTYENRPEKSKPVPRAVNLTKRLLVICLALVVVAGLTIALLAWSLQRSLSHASQSISQAVANPSPQTVRQALTAINSAKMLLGLADIPLPLRDNQSFKDDYVRLSFAQHTLESSVALSTAQSKLDGILHPGKIPVSQALSDAKLNITKANENVALAAAEQKLLASSSSNYLGSQDLMKSQATRQSELTYYTNALTFLDSLYASNVSDNTFALVVLDNNELRPAGGVVSALVSLTIRGANTPLVDSYVLADQAFTLDQDAPKAVKDYLRHGKLTLQDSMWNFSFEPSIAPFEPLLARTVNKPIAGYIGIDLYALKQLVGLTGPITLPQFAAKENEPFIISEQTFDEQLSKLYELSTFTNGEKRNTVTAEITKAIIEKIQSSKITYYDLSQEFMKLYKEKHVAISFTSPTLQAFIRPVDQLKANNDTIAVVDANISLNKVNPLVKRTVRHNLTIGKNEVITEQLLVTYTNTSPSNQWPLGTYQTYTRVVLPSDWKVIKTLVNDKKPTNPTETEDLGTTKATGALISVLPNTSATLEVDYQRPRSLIFTNGEATVSAHITKQPGTVTDTYEVVVQSPGTLKVSHTSPQFDQSDTGLLTKTTLDTDKYFEVTFAKP